jgi:hypothetical protein
VEDVDQVVEVEDEAISTGNPMVATDPREAAFEQEMVTRNSTVNALETFQPLKMKSPRTRTVPPTMMMTTMKTR